MYGAVHAGRISRGGQHTFQPSASNDNIVFDSDAKGRLAGTVIRITFIDENKILVEAHTVGDGTLATPFTTS
jgi:hypothetical protein